MNTGYSPHSPHRRFLCGAGLASLLGCAHTPAPSSRDAAAELSPAGRVRAAINLGNPILAGLDTNGSPRGVSVDLAFVAIDPVRGADMEYTAPYVIIEGSYLVRDGSRPGPG